MEKKMQPPVISSLKNWDGKSDVILILGSENDVQIKLCPANVLHHVVQKYRTFIESHHLVLDEEVIDDQLVVIVHWQPNGD